MIKLMLILTLMPFVAMGQSFEEIREVVESFRGEISAPLLDDKWKPDFKVVEVSSSEFVAADFDLATGKTLIYINPDKVSDGWYVLKIFSQINLLVKHIGARGIKDGKSDKKISLKKIRQIFGSMNGFGYIDIKELGLAKDNEKVKIRKKLHSLMLESSLLSKYDFSKRNLHSFLEDAFGVADLQNINIVDKSAQLNKAMESFKEIDWERAQLFTHALGSKELDHAISTNDRKFVSNYLKEKLPVDIMTDFEINFWTSQIRAIESPGEELLVYRGGPITDKNIPLAKTLISRRVTEFMYTPTRFFELASIVYSLPIASAMYRHSSSTSLHLISTTPDLEVANEFANDSDTLIKLKISKSRLFNNPMVRFGESEILVPLIIFPEEVTKVYKGFSRKTLPYRARGRLKKSAAYMESGINVLSVPMVGSDMGCKSALK